MKNPLLFFVFLFFGLSTISYAQDENLDNQFFKSIEDYVNNNPIPGITIQSGSFEEGPFGGYSFKIKEGSGKGKTTNTKDLPSQIFTYRRQPGAPPYLMRLIGKEAYIYLSAGKLSYYAMLSDQQKRYTSVGLEGELKKFKNGDFEDALEKHNLLKAYKSDKPKREFQDDVNDYFNKTINWQVKYFNLLNEKLK